MTKPNQGTLTGHTIEFIQVLRGLAALAVVILHAGWEHADYGADLRIRHALSSGIAGVDLFFVISGFIMYCTIPVNAEGWQAAWQFAVKRFSRIWPPYAVWTLVLVLMTLLVPEPKLLLPAWHLRDLAFSLLFLPTSRLFFAPAYTLPVLDVGWTLYYEAYFYASLAVCLWFGRWKWAVFAGWLTLAIVVIPLLRGAPLLDPNLFPPGNALLLNTLTSPIMWEFAAGVAIGWIYRQGIRFPSASVGIAATVIASAFLVVQCVVTKQVLHGLTGAGLPITLIVLSLALTPRGQHGTWKPMLWLGKVSFSLYLAHKPVILALETILSIRRVRLDPFMLATFVLVACMVSIIVAGISYHLLEAGLSNRIRDILLTRDRFGTHVIADATVHDPSPHRPAGDA